MDSMQFKNEYRKISRILEKHHSIFYKMWEYGVPEITETISTACLIFDEENYFPLKFCFNPKFWESLDTNSRAFIIAHECLHALLDHGFRAKNIQKSFNNKNIVNVAMDIAVNHTLVNSFGFIREDISVAETGCWVDTIFKDEIVDPNLSFEEYFVKLIGKSQNYNLNVNAKDLETILKDLNSKCEQSNTQSVPADQQSNKTITVNIFDDHESFNSDLEKLFREINETLDDYEKYSFKEKIQSFNQGENIPNSLTLPKKSKLTPTQKLEKIVKTWKRIGFNIPDESEQWIKPNRRNTMLPEDCLLPNYAETDDQDYCKSKLNAWIFLDISGSCAKLTDHFFMAYDTISEKKFNKNMFVFGDRAAEIKDRNIKVSVGGGTNFIAVKNCVESVSKNTGIEPDVVIIITDGASTHPQSYPFPKKWNWFLENTFIKYPWDKNDDINQMYEVNKRAIPKEMNVYELSDFFAIQSTTL